MPELLIREGRTAQEAVGRTNEQCGPLPESSVRKLNTLTGPQLKSMGRRILKATSLELELSRRKGEFDVAHKSCALLDSRIPRPYRDPFRVLVVQQIPRFLSEFGNGTAGLTSDLTARFLRQSSFVYAQTAWSGNRNHRCGGDGILRSHDRALQLHTFNWDGGCTRQGKRVFGLLEVGTEN